MASWGACRSPNSPASMGGPKAPPDPPPGGQGPPPCRQARMVRMAREHEVIMARNMMSNHTDMQDKYCGHSNNINPIQSQYKGNRRRGAAAEGRSTSFVVAAYCRHVSFLALNGVNVVAVTTIVALHVGVIRHHVPCRYDLRR